MVVLGMWSDCRWGFDATLPVDAAPPDEWRVTRITGQALS